MIIQQKSTSPFASLCRRRWENMSDALALDFDFRNAALGTIWNRDY